MAGLPGLCFLRQHRRRADRPTRRSRRDSTSTDDGSVFFTSVEALVLRDTNSRRDAYEWKEGQRQLISTGTSNFDSGLLGVSADGVDAFFFTRATLAPRTSTAKR